MSSRGCKTDFTYTTVEIFSNQPLGKGSYGMVCKAKVDDLVCAAKIIHSTFFEDVDPSSTKIMTQFEEECDLLSALRHPCIVQYLGRYQNPDRLPVLLLELMDESLTKFLERFLTHAEIVPYHIQMNLCHDVAVAISFLHSCDILHRDLSSNNVLLIAGSRAKVADFGMAKLLNPCKSSLTQCPGTMVYMAPEALRIPSVYSDKLDVFALGVLMLQMITRLFPSPSIAKRTIHSESLGTIEQPVPELERRKEDLEKVPLGHPLLQLAVDCLADKEDARPSASVVCQILAELKSQTEYKASCAESRERISVLRNEVTTLVTNVQNLEEKVTSQECSIKILERTAAAKKAEIDELMKELDCTRNELRQASSNSCCDTNNQTSSDPRRVDLQTSMELEGMLDLTAPHSSLWYHGPISRDEAAKRLNEVAIPGAYLVRLSQSESGKLVLSFLDGLHCVHHFVISQLQGLYNIGGTVWFTSLSKLIGFYGKHSDVIGKRPERLDVPVRPAMCSSLPQNVS